MGASRAGGRLSVEAHVMAQAGQQGAGHQGRGSWGEGEGGYLLREAHLKEAVGLIQHEVLHRAEAHALHLLQVVDQPPCDPPARNLLNI